MAAFFLHISGRACVYIFSYICRLKNEYMDIYEKIKELRARSGYTARELAERSGVPQSAISLIERGKKPNVSFATLDKLVRAMGYRLDVVLDV